MRHIITNILLFFFSVLSAQETLITISEDSSLKRNEYDNLFNLLSENKTQINGLFKINTVDWGQLSPSLIYEQHLFASFSIEPSIKLDAFSISQQNGINYILSPELKLKYYHNFAYREKRGRNTNGFSGNYVMASYLTTLSDSPDLLETVLNTHYFYDYDLSDSQENENYAIGFLHLGYGFQRQLLNIGYFDFSFGINIQTWNHNIDLKDPMPFIKIGIGFGITSQKAKELTY